MTNEQYLASRQSATEKAFKRLLRLVQENSFGSTAKNVTDLMTDWNAELNEINNEFLSSLD